MCTSIRVLLRTAGIRLRPAPWALLTLVPALIMLAWSPAGLAQVPTDIVRDGSLGAGPAGSILDLNADHVFEIGETHGARPGGSANLFHSFETFNLGAGDTALFTADPTKTTQNVLSRVTGGTRSDIYGTLASDIPGANFYFLNPAGIIFGPDATLNVQGAFHASTADALEFSSGERFEASLSGSVPTLAFAAPAKFGFLGDGSRQLIVDGSTLWNRAGISLSGGTVRIENGAQVDSSTADSEAAGDISIDAAETVLLMGKARISSSTSGAGAGGNISVTASDVQINDGSGISVSTTDSGPTGNISIVASGDVVLAGTVSPGRFFPLPDSSFIEASTDSDGAVGAIEIEARNIFLRDGATVGQRPVSSVPVYSGNITLTASESFEITERAYFVKWPFGDHPPDEPVRGIGGRVSAGEGSIAIKASSVLLTDGARLDAESSSGAGAISIDADDVRVEDGSWISASTEGPVPAGDITIAAKKSLVVAGLDLWGQSSGIVAETHDPGEPGPGAKSVAGGGGSIVIEAESVLVGDEGKISTASFGAGAGGEISITADDVRVESGASISGSAYGAGDAGSVSITAKDGVTVTGETDWVLPDWWHTPWIILQSTVSSSALEGAGGSIDIDAPNVRLADGASLVASVAGAGAGGSIFITASDVRLEDEARIRADASGSGNAGSIDIDTNNISLSNSTIDVSSAASDAGTIHIDVSDTLNLVSSSINATAQDGVGGDISINGEGIEVAADGSLSALKPDEGAVYGEMVHLVDSEISSAVAGGIGGNVLIDPEFIILDDSTITARANEGGEGGNVLLVADVVLSNQPFDETVQASNRVEVHSPEVNLESELTPLSTEFLNASALLRPSCAARGAGARGGSFVVARRRGLPTSPEDLLLAFDGVERGGEVAVAETEADEALPPAPGAPPEMDAVKVAQRALAQGTMAFRGGHFEEAGQRWFEASELYAESGDAPSRGDALRGLAQTQQAVGQYTESLKTLQVALALAEQSGDKVRIASALGSLGSAYTALGQIEAAEALLTRSTEVAAQTGDGALSANLLNNLGNHHAARQAFEEALAAYTQSVTRARETGDRALEATALSNAARAALDAGQLKYAADLLVQTQARAQALPATHDTVYVLIHMAKSFERLAALSPEGRKASLLNAHAALRKASELAQAMGDLRARSYALGNLGALYQSEGRIDEALLLTRQALQTAKASEAPESIYRWHWQAGKLLWAQGNAHEAIRSYRRAVEILEETRQETLARYGSAQVYFRRVVAPVYLDLVDALLQGSGLLADSAQSQRLLVEARATVEKLKAAELRDYFRDECVADLEAKRRSPEAVSASAAVVYPIVLPDRLEMLVSLPSGLARYPVAVAATQLTEEVRRLRKTLGGVTRAYLPASQQLYDWLVRPFEAALGTAGIDTLVFVPDGALRTIPMAALHDGEGFLIERYALAITPGLELVDPRPLDRSHMNLLLAGISESVQGYPALAGVPEELASVQRLYGGEVLLDEEFLLDRMEREMRVGQPSVVHIASHGQFTGDPATSFLLAYDGKLTMDRLGEYVGMAKFRDEPLELLVLSACETAAGDERAALGLAGLAIRAGARSALGSLWPIGDEATSQLVADFYRALEAPSVTKAQALQRAQLELLASGLYDHPRYWSPFLLISNWL